MNILLILITLFLAGCATECTWNCKQRTDWLCIADVNKDSNCKVINCSTIKDVCKTGNYRIMKNFVLWEAYIYSTGEPRTDIEKCIKSGLEDEKRRF